MAPPLRRNQRSSNRSAPATIPVTGLALGLFAAVAAGFAASRSLRKKTPRQSQAQPAHSENQSSEEGKNSNALEELDTGSTNFSVNSGKGDCNGFQEDEGTQENKQEEGKLVQGVKEVYALCNKDGSISECSLLDVNSLAVKHFLWSDLKQERASPEKMKSRSATEAGFCDGDFASQAYVSSSSPREHSEKTDCNGFYKCEFGQCHPESPILEAHNAKPVSNVFYKCEIDQSHPESPLVEAHSAETENNGIYKCEIDRYCPEKNFSDANQLARKKACHEFADFDGNVDGSLSKRDFDDVAFSEFTPDREFSIGGPDREFPVDGPEKEFCIDVPNSAMLSDVKSILAGNGERLLSPEDIAVSGLDGLISVGEAILASVAADEGKNEFIEDEASSHKNKDGTVSTDRNLVYGNLDCPEMKLYGDKSIIQKIHSQSVYPSNANGYSDLNSFSVGVRPHQQSTEVCNTPYCGSVNDRATETSCLRSSTDTQAVFDNVQNVKGVESQADSCGPSRNRDKEPILGGTFDISVISPDLDGASGCSFSGQDSDPTMIPGTSSIMVSDTNVNSIEFCDLNRKHGETSPSDPSDQNVEFDNGVHSDQLEPSGLGGCEKTLLGLVECESVIRNDELNLEGVDGPCLKFAASQPVQRESSDIESDYDAESNPESEIALEEINCSNNERSESLKQDNYSEINPNSKIVIETISNSGNEIREPSKEGCIGDDSESNPDCELAVDEINYCSSRTLEYSKEDAASNLDSEIDIEEINTSSSETNGPSKDETEGLGCRIGSTMPQHGMDMTGTNIDVGIEESQTVLGIIDDPSHSSGFEGRTSPYILDGIHHIVRTMQKIPSDVNERPDSNSVVTGFDANGTINPVSVLHLNTVEISRSCSIESTSFPIQEILKNFDIRDDISVENDADSNLEGLPGTCVEDALSKYEPTNFTVSTVDKGLLKVASDEHFDETSSSCMDEQISDGDHIKGNGPIENNEGYKFTSCAELGLFLVQDLCSGSDSRSSVGCNLELENCCTDSSVEVTHHVAFSTDGRTPESENGVSGSKNSAILLGHEVPNSEASQSGCKQPEIQLTPARNTNLAEASISSSDEPYLLYAKSSLAGSSEFELISGSGIQDRDNSESGIQHSDHLDLEEYGVKSPGYLDVEESGIQSSESQDLEESAIESSENLDLEKSGIHKSEDQDLEEKCINESADSVFVSSMSQSHCFSINAGQSAICLEVDYNLPATTCLCCCTMSTNGIMHDIGSQVDTKSSLHDSFTKLGVGVIMYGHLDEEGFLGINGEVTDVLSPPEVHEREKSRPVVGDESSSCCVNSSMHQEDGKDGVFVETSSVEDEISPIADVPGCVESSVYQKDGEVSFIVENNKVVSPQEVPEHSGLEHQESAPAVDDEISVHVKKQQKDYSFCANDESGLADFNYACKNHEMAEHFENGELNEHCFDAQFSMAVLGNISAKGKHFEHSLDAECNFPGVDTEKGEHDEHSFDDECNLANVISITEAGQIEALDFDTCLTLDAGQLQENEVVNSVGANDDCNQVDTGSSTVRVVELSPLINNDETLIDNDFATDVGPNVEFRGGSPSSRDDVDSDAVELPNVNELLESTSIYSRGINEPSIEHSCHLFISCTNSVGIPSITGESTVQNDLVGLDDNTSEIEPLIGGEPKLNVTNEILHVNNLLGLGERSSAEIVGDENSTDVGSRSGNESLVDDHIHESLHVNIQQNPLAVDEQSTDASCCSGNEEIDTQEIRECVSTFQLRDVNGITVSQQSEKNEGKLKEHDSNIEQNFETLVKLIGNILAIDPHFKRSEQTREKDFSGQTTPEYSGEDLNKMEEPRELRISAGLKTCEDLKEDVWKPTEGSKKRRRRQKKRTGDTEGEVSIVNHASEGHLVVSNNLESELHSKSWWLYRIQNTAPYLHLEIGVLCMLIVLLSFIISHLGMSQPPPV